MYHYRVNQIKLAIGEPKDRIPGRIGKMLGISSDMIQKYDIRRESIDARNKSDIRLVYTVDFFTRKPVRRKNKNLQEVGEERPAEPVSGTQKLQGRPLIVGFGPCGIFAALKLAEKGYRPVVIERGQAMAERVADVEAFRQKGLLNPESNVLFGEGGAGTFSDGKLTSGADGVVRFTGLYSGSLYRVTEVKAPKGYQLLTEPVYEGGIRKDDGNFIRLILNNHQFRFLN